MVIGADKITEETTLEEVITRFPMAARVFVRRRMNCVGCDIAREEGSASDAPRRAHPSTRRHRERRKQ